MSGLSRATAPPPERVADAPGRQVTDGNLATHLRKLEDAGYVGVEKGFVGRKPLTRIHMTAAGRDAFVSYLDAIGKLVNEERA